MQDLLILELLIIFLLFVALVRPLVKGFRNIQGIILIPYLVLAIQIGLYAAYGFRPELIPLFLVSFFFCIYNLTKLSSLFNKMKLDDYREVSIAGLSIRTMFFLVASFFALYYFPQDPPNKTERDAAFFYTDNYSGTELFVQSYLPKTRSLEERFPIILMIPPVHGSVQVVDSVCSALSERGFFVLSYSRSDLDYQGVSENIEKYPLTSSAFMDMGAFIAGASYKKANNLARNYERERLSDIYILLELIKQQAGQAGSPLYHADKKLILGIGYGSGGAALALYASAAPVPEFKGFIAVESPVYSFMEPQYPQKLDVSIDQSVFKKISHSVSAFIEKIRFRKDVQVISSGSIKVPAFFLCSDRFLSERYRETRYASILSLVQESEHFASVFSMSGTGIFDYSELPELYPVYSAMFGSLQKDTRDIVEVRKETVALIETIYVLLQSLSDSKITLEENILLESESFHVECNDSANLILKVKRSIHE